MAPHPRRDGQLLYEWIEANFRYFVSADPPTMINERGRAGDYSAKDRVIATLQALLSELDSADHERVLRFATGKRFQEELGPVEEACRCRWCEGARERQEMEILTPRQERVRSSLVQTLADQFQRTKWSRDGLRTSSSWFRSYERPPVRIEESVASVDEFPKPSVNPAFKKSFAPFRFFFGTEERLNVYLRVVPPAWPLLSKLLGPPPSGEDAQYPPDVLECVTAVAAHVGYVSLAPISLQRKVLEWTWGTPKVRSTRWTCQALECDLPCPLPRTCQEVPDDWIHHKFGHALNHILLDALRHKCPVNRGLGMPLIHGLYGNVYVKTIIVGNPYVYFPH